MAAALDVGAAMAAAAASSARMAATTPSLHHQQALGRGTQGDTPGDTPGDTRGTSAEEVDAQLSGAERSSASKVAAC